MPVISQFFTGAKQLHIELIEPVVFLRVDAQDPSTHVLRGEVSVLFTKPISSTSVTLKLFGKSSILWPEGIQGGKSIFEETIHEQELILQPESKSVLKAGLYRWPFQFFLSNHLPETIEDDRGKVFYYLIAIMHRGGVTHSPLRARRDLLLLRTPHWSERPPDGAQEQHLSECDASIRLEKFACSSGTHLPLELSILPRVKHLTLKSIRVSLTEKRKYTMNQTRRLLSHDFKIKVVEAKSLFDPPQDIQPALELENAHISLCDWPVQHRLVLLLPNCDHVNHSSTYSNIHIKHTLKIDIHLHKDSDFSICFKAPITLLDCRLRDDYDVLPTYQQALLPAEISEEGLICPQLSLYKKKKPKKVEVQPPAYEDI
ncbi:hypothetical protein G6F56_001580 [Rhizopus delemar]|uniref:Arrestin C-terminal-like domain-containing protein n=1 Tax=Rhizopus stolonifer TaxID=4846 RepID=A0A367KNF2_RHIST|nr:hypothetical protein G6F56_001580 [Rhizopus delemar]RCI03372.1 hypothetical protein CU098_003181 [Rhizopus stolonifer]